MYCFHIRAARQHFLSNTQNSLNLSPPAILPAISVSAPSLWTQTAFSMLHDLNIVLLECYLSEVTVHYIYKYRLLTFFIGTTCKKGKTVECVLWIIQTNGNIWKDTLQFKLLHVILQYCEDHKHNLIHLHCIRLRTEISERGISKPGQIKLSACLDTMKCHLTPTSFNIKAAWVKVIPLSEHQVCFCCQHDFTVAW